MNNTTSPELFKLSIGDRDFVPMTLETVERQLYLVWPDIWCKKQERMLQVDDFQEVKEFWDEKSKCWEILSPFDGQTVWAFFKKV